MQNLAEVGFKTISPADNNMLKEYNKVNASRAYFQKFC